MLLFRALKASLKGARMTLTFPYTEVLRRHHRIVRHVMLLQFMVYIVM